MGAYVKEGCINCGKVVCEYESDSGYYCGGEGLQEGCPKCGIMYPVYTPVFPDVSHQTFLASLAALRTQVKSPEIIDSAVKMLQESSFAAWNPMPLSKTSTIKDEMMRPDVTLDDDTRHNLIAVLEKEGLTEECENPEHVTDWLTSTPSGERETITLYTNGGDAYRPAGIFLRQNNQGQFVHVPLKQFQNALIESSYAATAYRNETRRSEGKAELTRYLESILNHPLGWRRMV